MHIYIYTHCYIHIYIYSCMGVSPIHPALPFYGSPPSRSPQHVFAEQHEQTAAEKSRFGQFCKKHRRPLCLAAWERWGVGTTCHDCFNRAIIIYSNIFIAIYSNHNQYIYIYSNGCYWSFIIGIMNNIYDSNNLIMISTIILKIIA